MKKKLIVFDLDGTLLNTVASISHHISKVFSQHGLEPMTIEEVMPILGLSSKYLVWQGLAQKGGGDLSDREKTEILDAYNASYLSDPIPLTEKYAGIDQLVMDLTAEGVLLAVNSNKPDAIVKVIIDHFFPDKPFALVRGFLESVPKKPDPAGLFQMLKELGLTKEETIYVGDSEVDAELAEAAGVDYILVTYGFRDRAALEGFQPLAFCDQPQAIGEVVRPLL